MDLQVEEVEEVTPDVAWMAPAAGGVRVTVVAHGAELPRLRCGEEIEAPMQLREFGRYRDPGAWQYADYLLAQGIGVHATVRAAKVSVVSAGEEGMRLPSVCGAELGGGADVRVCAFGGEPATAEGAATERR